MRIKFLIIFIGINLCLYSQTESSISGKYQCNLPGNKSNGNFKFNIKNADKITFNQKTQLSEAESRFDKNFRFLSMSRKYSETHLSITDSEIDEFKVTLDKKSLLINFITEGKISKSKKVKIKGDNFRVFDNLFLTLQRDLKNRKGDFNSFLIFPDAASGYKASFKFYKSKNINTDSYSIPGFFKESTNFDTEVIICEVGLLGMAGKFFPYKFNFIFNNSKEYEFLGYWGGHPETPNYYIADRGDL